MKQVKLFFATTILALCLLITNSCSQSAGSENPVGTFEATTPCDDVSKTLLEIPSGTKCEMMKWKLTLYQDPKSFAPSTYKLIYVYGLPKQGTKDFLEGAKTIELKGEWIIDKGTSESVKGVVYKLKFPNSHTSLSFQKLDTNLLHLLDSNNHMMVGNGAWSYTLNRINPITASPVKFISKTASQLLIESDSSTVGIFEGRTICIGIPREINGISADGCLRTKWRLTLFQDPKTHKPTTFQLQNIYVGKGDTRYSNTGKWVVTQGTKTDPRAIVYQLEMDGGKSQYLEFLKADDNILFFLDNDRNLMVGDGYSSFTLNRAKK